MEEKIWTSTTQGPPVLSVPAVSLTCPEASLDEISALLGQMLELAQAAAVDPPLQDRAVLQAQLEQLQTALDRAADSLATGQPDSGTTNTSQTSP